MLTKEEMRNQSDSVIKAKGECPEGLMCWHCFYTQITQSSYLCNKESRLKMANKVKEGKYDKQT